MVRDRVEDELVDERQAFQRAAQRVASRLGTLLGKQPSEPEDVLPITTAACGRDRGEDVIAVERALPGQRNDFEHVVGAQAIDVGCLGSIEEVPVVETAVEDVVAMASSIVPLEVQDRATEAVAECPPKRALVR